MEWKEVERAQFLRWDEPKEVVGRFVEIETVPGQFEKESVRVTLDSDGTVVRFFAPAMLASILREANLQVGALVKIVFTGQYTKSKAGRPVKEFKVFVAS